MTTPAQFTAEQIDTIVAEKLEGTRFTGDELIAIPLENMPEDLGHMNALRDVEFPITINRFGHLCVHFFLSSAMTPEVIELTFTPWQVDNGD